MSQSPVINKNQLRKKAVFFWAITYFFLLCIVPFVPADNESWAVNKLNPAYNIIGEALQSRQIPVIPELAASSAIGQIRYYVDGEKAISGNGRSWATAFKTIREAVTAAGNYSEIWVKTGTYNDNWKNREPDGIQLNKVIYLFGGFTGREIDRKERNCEKNPVMLDAKNQGRYFFITSDVYLDGFTIMNGRMVELADGTGGAVKIVGCSPVIKHCVFLDNKIANAGGAIHISNGSPSLQDCVFRGNGGSDANARGWAGGAVFIENGYPVFLDCIFTNNYIFDGRGGALYGPASLVRCFFRHNKCCWGSGGAVMLGYDGTFSIQASVFIENTASYSGGAVYGKGTILDCRFEHNIASDGGGAVCISGYTGEENRKSIIANCVFTNNAATNELEYFPVSGGGAICTGEQTDTYVANCLFVNNTAGEECALNGGAYVNGGNTTIIECTFWGNMVYMVSKHNEYRTSEGGIIYNKPGKSLTIFNSILWNNFGSPVEINGAPADVSYCVLDQEDLAQINHNRQCDPCFPAPLAGIFRLLPDSPCSGTGAKLDVTPLCYNPGNNLTLY